MSWGETSGKNVRNPFVGENISDINLFADHLVTNVMIISFNMLCPSPSMKNKIRGKRYGAYVITPNPRVCKGEKCGDHKDIDTLD